MLYCQSPSGAGTVWAYVRIPAPPAASRLLFGLTTGALSGSNPIVNNITAADGGVPPTTHASDLMTVVNWCGWTWSGASGVSIMFTPTAITGTAGSGANIGSGNFVQAPCGA